MGFCADAGDSLAGALVLRHAGGNHIARMRVAMADGGFTALQADGPGGLILLAGILLFIPGFITDAWAFCCFWRRCGGRSARCSGSNRRPGAPTAWSISSRNSGIGSPIPR